MRLFLGIDPGLSGGLAAITADGLIQDIRPMPVAGGEIYPAELAGWISGLRCFDPRVEVARLVLEKVGAMPKQGVSSSFNFGCGWGMVRGVCAAMHVPVLLVTPPAWKKTVLAGLPHDKDGAVRYCATQWPTAQLVQPRCRVPHDGIADALCLAEYGRRMP